MQDKNKTENPSAFPTTKDNFSEQPHLIQVSQGMTLRDYFAAKAMQALLSNPTQHEVFLVNDGIDTILLSKQSWDVADAMLEERSKDVK